MAEARALVLNNALCFLLCKYGTTPVKLLRSALLDFYSENVISEAKVRLLNDVKALNLANNLPHIPQRRSGEAKLQHEVDDLLLILTFVDEAKAIDNLPRYVASSPDNMPSCRLYEGDLNIILNMMKDVNRRVGEVETSLMTFGQHVMKPFRPHSQSAYLAGLVCASQLSRARLPVDSQFRFLLGILLGILFVHRPLRLMPVPARR